MQMQRQIHLNQRIEKCVHSLPRALVICSLPPTEFTDPQENEIFTLKNKHFKLQKSFHGVGPDGNDIFEVKGHFSCMSSIFLELP